MKRFLVLALVCLAVISCNKDDDDNNGNNGNTNNCSGYTAIPDSNFENALIKWSLDQLPRDGQVLTNNICGVQVINFYDENISDLTGIEDFIALNYLGLEGNHLTNLDLSNNTALVSLQVRNNHLTNLNVSQNTGLISLNCQDNQLISLDLSNNISLEWLVCSNNPLTCLNLKNGNNTKLVPNSYTTYHPFFQNLNLTCIEVDDPNWATQNWTYIDNGVTFSTNCNYPAGCF